MKKIIAIAFAAVLFGAGAGVASAAPARPGPLPAHDTVTRTFHCPAPHGIFTIRADPWVMGQYEWYYAGQGCTYTS